MKTGILFDLDGTLMDTLEDILDSSNYALSRFGYPPRTLKEMRRFVGNGAANQIRMSAPEGTDPQRLEEILAVYKPYYTDHCQIKTAPYPGAVEALKKLEDKFPLGIVSNKPDPAVKSICGQYFPGIYALGEAPDCPRKPQPDMIYKAMAAIGADRCIYVGDSEVDVITAKNAGIPCLSVLWGFRDREDMEAVGAEYFCEDPLTLVESLEALLSRLGLDGNS